MDISTRYWALKCVASIGLLYKNEANKTVERLCIQFHTHDDPDIWSVAINGICQMAVAYTFEFLDRPEDEELERDVMLDKFSHIYNMSEHEKVKMTLLKGFCLLILYDQHNSDLMPKILLAYFSADDGTNDEIRQTLAIFFEDLVKRNKQAYLLDALKDTIFELCDSTDGQYNFAPDIVIRFANAMVAPRNPSQARNMHHRLADIILDIMDERDDNVDLTRILAKSLSDLNIGSDVMVCQRLTASVKALIDSRKISDATSIKSLNKFISILNGMDVTRTTRQSAATNIEFGASAMTVNTSAVASQAITDDDGHSENNDENRFFEDSDNENVVEDDNQAVVNATAVSTIRRLRKSLNVNEESYSNTSLSTSGHTKQSSSQTDDSNADESGASSSGVVSSRFYFQQ